MLGSLWRALPRVCHRSYSKECSSSWNYLLSQNRDGNLVDDCNDYLSKLCYRKDWDRTGLLFKDMVSNRINPNQKTFTIILQALSKATKQKATVLPRLESFWEYMLSLSNTPNIQHYTILIQTYILAGELEGAKNAYETMKQNNMVPDEPFFAIIMDAYLQKGKHDEISELLSDMPTYKVRPSVRIFSVIANSVILQKDLEQLAIIIDFMEREKVEVDTVFFNSLLSTLAKTHVHTTTSVEYIIGLMESCHVPMNTGTYTTLIRAFGYIGNTTHVSFYYKILISSGQTPSFGCFNHCIMACSKAGDLRLGEYFYKELLKYGYTPNTHTATSLVVLYCSHNRLDTAIQLKNIAHTTQTSPLPSKLYHTLVDALVRKKQYKDARDLVTEMKELSYNTTAVQEILQSIPEK